MMRFSSREEHRIQKEQRSILSDPCSRAVIKAKYLKVGLLGDEEVDLRQWQVYFKKTNWFFICLKQKVWRLGHCRRVS